MPSANRCSSVELPFRKGVLDRFGVCVCVYMVSHLAHSLLLIMSQPARRDVDVAQTRFSSLYSFSKREHPDAYRLTVRVTSEAKAMQNHGPSYPTYSLNGSPHLTQVSTPLPLPIKLRLTFVLVYFCSITDPPICSLWCQHYCVKLDVYT